MRFTIIARPKELYSIIAAGFVCAQRFRREEIKKKKKEVTEATVTEASFQTTGKERNRSGALAKKNDAIALKLGLKRSGNNLFGERRGMLR